MYGAPGAKPVTGFAPGAFLLRPAAVPSPIDDLQPSLTQAHNITIEPEQ